MRTNKKKPAYKKKKVTTTRATKTTSQTTRKFFIKVPVEVRTASQESKIKADARKSFKGVTFTKK